MGGFFPFIFSFIHSLSASIGSLFFERGRRRRRRRRRGGRRRGGEKGEGDRGKGRGKREREGGKRERGKGGKGERGKEGKRERRVVVFGYKRTSNYNDQKKKKNPTQTSLLPLLKRSGKNIYTMDPFS